MFDSKLILITLLVKLGVAASVSSALARSRSFQNLLFRKTAAARRRWACWPGYAFHSPSASGCGMIVPNFYAADIAFETVIILGVLLGPLSAMAGGDAARCARRCSITNI